MQNFDRQIVYIELTWHPYMNSLKVVGVFDTAYGHTELQLAKALTKVIAPQHWPGALAQLCIQLWVELRNRVTVCPLGIEGAKLCQCSDIPSCTVWGGNCENTHESNILPGWYCQYHFAVRDLHLAKALRQNIAVAAAWGVFLNHLIWLC